MKKPTTSNKYRMIKGIKGGYLILNKAVIFSVLLRETLTRNGLSPEKDAQTREEMQDLLLLLWKRFSHTIIFVTHDVNEAVLLTDRVLLMGKNPGRIRKEILVNLPRPRKKDEPDLISLTRHLYSELRD